VSTLLQQQISNLVARHGTGDVLTAIADYLRSVEAIERRDDPSSERANELREQADTLDYHAVNMRDAGRES
jgi:hypothetical protein